MKRVTIYTDGSCIINPGKGGYGAVIIHGVHRKEISTGYRKTTNNRMELLAAIKALNKLKEPCEVTLHSDSTYLVNGMTKGWAKRWQADGWKRKQSGRVPNSDLWRRLLDLDATHRVKFVWVRGHAGNTENERCDKLANEAARSEDLLIDEEYERTAWKGTTRRR